MSVHGPDSYADFIAQRDAEHNAQIKQAARPPVMERVYEVQRISPGKPRTTIAITSKASADRLIAGLADPNAADRYRVVSYMRASLPGLER